MGLGKEILLIYGHRMSRFPSRNMIYYGIIRMHENKTCEISLLLCSNLSVWSQKTSMLGLQTNLVYPSKETRTSKAPHAVERLKPGLPRKIRCQSFGQASLRHSITDLSLPISTSLEPFYCTSKFSKITLRSAYPVSRRALVPLSKEALDSASDGDQVVSRKNSVFSRSCTSLRQRRQNGLATGLCDRPAGAQSPYSRSRRRQFEWHEEDRQTRRMGSPALSLSLDSEIPNSVPPPNAQTQRRSCARRNLSADSSSSRNYQRISFKRFTGTTNTSYPNFLWHSPHSGCSPRLPSISKVLPHVSNASGVEPAKHNQHGRVHGLHYSGFTATQSFSFKPSIAIEMGNDIRSITKGIKLQRQESSTDLINPTPICDIQF